MASQEFNEFNNARNEQIKTHKEGQSVDFNVHNYDIEELTDILGFQYIPINKGIIDRRMMELKRKFKGQKKYESFFNEAKQRLLENLELFNEPTWTEPYNRESGMTGRVLQQQFQDKTEEEKKHEINKIIDKKDIIGIPKIPVEETYQKKDVTQGTKNPFNITEIKRVVNFDSHYRQILDPSSVNCDGEWEPNLESRLYTSTSYTVTLSEPLISVISITLDSVEIPNSWYVFSEDYGTNQLRFSFKDYEGNKRDNVIDIPNGNYGKEELVSNINEKIWDVSFADMAYSPLKGYFDWLGNWSTTVGTATTDICDNFLPFPIVEFKYDKNQNKISIYNYDPSGEIFTFHWYDSTNEGEIVCAATQTSETPKPGGKVDYNLGWLLGFRMKSSNVTSYRYQSTPYYESDTTATQSSTPPGGALKPDIKGVFDHEKYYYGKTVPRSTVDIKGPQYFLLTLDDFNNNKPNKDLISLVDATTRDFKIPTYFNTQTMDKAYQKGTYYPGREGEAGYECRDVADTDNNARGCSTNDLNKDVNTNLTQAQKYTYEQIMLARNQKGVDRYTSPNSTDIFSRFSVNRDPADWETSIVYKNRDKEITKRKYFGPVKLVKFGIRLLNDKGFEVNLNDRDWSFSIIVTQQYQY